MNIAIEAHGLTRTYTGTVALDDVSVQIRRDTITGLLGRNGAGKTTFMSIAAAQDRPSSGSVRVNGEPPFENAAVIEQMCFIRDNQRYPDDYKLKHAIRAASIFYPNWSQELADELIDQFRIPHKTTIKKMSRGQLSAIGIVLGLASRASVTFFDEPHLGLDATARNLFYDVLLRDYQQHPRTMLVSTHLIDEMDRLLERVIVLDQGRVIRDTDVDELRGSVFAVAGKLLSIEAFLETRTVISRRTIGGLGTAIVDGVLGENDRRAAHDLGLETTQVSLQELVAAYGLADPHESMPVIDTPVDNASYLERSAS